MQRLPAHLSAGGTAFFSRAEERAAGEWVVAVVQACPIRVGDVSGGSVQEHFHDGHPIPSTGRAAGN
jgi:hypothetical protein